MSIRVNLKSCISTAPTLLGYKKLARDKAHGILWPCTRA